MTSNAIVPFESIQRMAEVAAKSKLFGSNLTPDQAMTIMLIAQAEGRHPMSAAKDYDIINGKPAKKAEAMLRDFLAAGGTVQWHQLDDAGAKATFSHPQGGTVTIDWNKERMQRAKITNEAMYSKYPRAMYRSRCVSEGVRTVCPSATGGLYVPEEVRAFAPEKNMGDAVVVAAERVPAPAAGSHTSSPDASGAEDAGAPLMASPEQIEAMHAALSENNVEIGKLLAKAEIQSLSDMPADDVPSAVRWIKKQGAKK